MTPGVEDELRALFAAIDDQVGPLPEPRPVEPRRRQPMVLAAAAAVLIALFAVATLALGRSGDVDVDTARDAELVEGNAFDHLASGVCERLERARSGVTPRFATVEAYLVSAQEQRAAIERAIVELRSIPAAAAEGRIVDEAVAGLEASLVLLDEVITAAGAGDRDEAATVWSGIDSSVFHAVEGLVERGVERCREP